MLFDDDGISTIDLLSQFLWYLMDNSDDVYASLICITTRIIKIWNVYTV